MNTHCRIGRITDKRTGRSVHVLKHQNEDLAYVMGRVRAALDSHMKGSPDNFGGFSFVVWDKDGTNVCEHRVKAGCIPTILVPDFVRNCLLARKIEEWTLDTINDQIIT